MQHSNYRLVSLGTVLILTIPNTEFDEIGDNKITLLNADIEGAEIKLLKSMQKVLINHRPVIAICVYHRADDLVEIPKFLNENLTDYYFILRKYQCGVSDARRTGELVLYAIPSERLLENSRM